MGVYDEDSVDTWTGAGEAYTDRYTERLLSSLGVTDLKF